MKNAIRIEKAELAILERLKNIAVIQVSVVIVTGVLVLLGWQFDITVFKQPIPGDVSMNPWTAVEFILSATCFLLWLQKNVTLQASYLIQVTAILIVLVGVSFFLAYFKIYDTGIGEWLFPAKVSATLLHNRPNIMAPLTAVNFICTGVSLLFFCNKKTELTQYLSLLVGFNALLAIIGYVYGVHEFYGVFSYYPMAVHTAICFLLLSTAFLFVCIDYGFMAAFASAYGGGKAARKLLPMAIIIPILLGIILLYGEKNGFYNDSFAAALYTIAIIIVFVLQIWKSLSVINRSNYLLANEMAANKKVHRQLKSLLNGMQRLMNISMDVICVIDAEGRFVEISANCYQLFGYTEEEMKGRKFIDLVYAEDRLKTQKATEEIAVTGSLIDFESRYSKKDGNYVPLIWTAIWLEDEKMMYCIVKDCTERLKAEKQLKEYHQRIAHILESITDGFIAMDETGILTYSNKEAERILSITKEVMSGKKLWDIHAFRKGDAGSGANIFYAQCQKATIQKVPVHFEAYMQPLNRWFDVNVYPSGEGLSIYFRDVTSRINNMQAIEEQNKKLGEIAWIQSHVVRAPLARIMGLISLLEDASFEEKEKADFMKHILSSARELDQIITEIVTKAEKIQTELESQPGVPE